MLRGKNQFTSQRLAIICLLEVSFPFATILLKHCGSFTVEKNWGFSQACTSSVDIFGKRNAEHCSKCCPSDLCNVNCKYHIFLTANLGVIFQKTWSLLLFLASSQKVNSFYWTPKDYFPYSEVIRLVQVYIYLMIEFADMICITIL